MFDKITRDEQMMKTFHMVLCATSLLIAAYQAQAMSLALAPKGDKVLKNNTIMTIHATCQIHASSSKKIIKIHGLKNTSHVNGKALNEGQSTSMTVYSEKTVEVTAEPGAQVTIVNMSNESLEAVCSA